MLVTTAALTTVTLAAIVVSAEAAGSGNKGDNPLTRLHIPHISENASSGNTLI
jgi:hypothetical protein